MRPYCPGTAEGEPKRERGESRKAKMAGIPKELEEQITKVTHQSRWSFRLY